MTRSPFGLGVILAACLALAGCLGGESSVRHLEQDEVAGVRLLSVGARLPPSASDVWIAEERFLDSSQRLRFDASLDEARSFAREILGRDPVEGEDPGIFHASGTRDWWLKAFPDGAEGGRRDEVNHRLLIEVVLLPMGDRARVWVAAGQG